MGKLVNLSVLWVYCLKYRTPNTYFEIIVKVLKVTTKVHFYSLKNGGKKLTQSVTLCQSRYHVSVHNAYFNLQNFRKLIRFK